MNKIFLVLLFSSFLCASQTQVLHMAFSHQPEHKVFFHTNIKDLKGWKIIQPESESMSKYYVVGFIALGLMAVVGGILWARWYSKEVEKL